MLGDRQPQAGARDSRVGGVDTVEFLESLLALGGGHADTLVADGNPVGAIDRFTGNADCAARRRVLDRIRQQVVHHLGDLGGVDLDAARRFAKIDFEAVVGRQAPVGRQVWSEDVAHRGMGFIDLQRPPGLETAKVEKVVKQFRHCPGLLDDEVEIFLLLLGAEVAFGQQLGKTENNRQRRAQLMCRRRDELALETVYASLLGDVAGRENESVESAFGGDNYRGADLVDLVVAAITGRTDCVELQAQMALRQGLGDPVRQPRLADDFPHLATQRILGRNVDETFGLVVDQHKTVIDIGDKKRVGNRGDDTVKPVAAGSRLGVGLFKLGILQLVLGHVPQNYQHPLGRLGVTERDCAHQEVAAFPGVGQLYFNLLVDLRFGGGNRSRGLVREETPEFQRPPQLGITSPLQRLRVIQAGQRQDGGVAAAIDAVAILPGHHVRDVNDQVAQQPVVLTQLLRALLDADLEVVVAGLEGAMGRQKALVEAPENNKSDTCQRRAEKRAEGHGPPHLPEDDLAEGVIGYQDQHCPHPHVGGVLQGHETPDHVVFIELHLDVHEAAQVGLTQEFADLFVDAVVGLVQHDPIVKLVPSRCTAAHAHSPRPFVTVEKFLVQGQ